MLSLVSGRLSPRNGQSLATGRDRWMVSYVDVLTLVLMFFLGIASTVARPAPVAKRTPPAPLAPKPIEVLSESRQALLRAQKDLEAQGINLRMEGQGLRISLPQAVLFESGNDTVSPEALPILARIADVLRDIPNDVRLVGHADSVPIHTSRFESNWALAMARSLRIQELLSHEYGIGEARLSIASYGPNRPTGSNDTPDGRALNRRVEILILDEAASTDQKP